jgi:acyl-coenzyme A synthetase/AMP-(fatty) acid ligase
VTANYIAYHAAERPQAIALIVQDRRITFAEFDRDLGKVTQALHALGRPPGSSAAIRCADAYFHWLLLLGFERLGVTTVSIDEREGEEAAPFLATIDFMLSDAPRISTVKAFQPITAEWRRQILDGAAAAGAPVPEVSVDAPLRIMRTSGTTGIAKRLHFARATRDAWLREIQWFSPYDIESRLLMTLPFTVEGAHSVMNLCLRAGAMVVMLPLNQTGAIPSLLTRYAINRIALLPIQLKQLLDELPADFQKPAGLELATFGGAIGNDLRALAHARLADRLDDIYGTNEVGFVSLRRTGGPDGVSLVAPTVRVEVVDDADAPLPDGEAGWLRIRSDGMFQGYLDDPAANERMIRDGWFYPGDVGVLLGNRRLKILGRGDELINIGGVKFGPDLLEDRVRAMVAVRDVGACSIRNRAGIGEVYLGVVKAPGEDDGAYQRVLDAVGTLGFGAFYVAKLDHIPRNPNGKIRRKQLKRAIADEIMRHDPTWPGRVQLDPAEIEDAGA